MLYLPHSLVLIFVTMAGGPPRTIVCLGDSVTKGVRPGVQPEETFSAQLEKQLHTSEQPVRVVNAGVGGNTTRDGLARFDRDVLDHHPAAVVIMFGLNDSWIDDGKEASRIAVSEYRANLQAMIQKLKERKCTIVLMTPNPALAPTYPPKRNATLKPYVDVVRELAAAEDVPLVDIYRQFAELALEGADLNAFFTDAMHPNPRGQRLIADALTAKLQPR